MASTSVAPMEVPTPDPSKLLQSWMEWERGEVTPGRVMANLKTGGIRVLLEELVAGGLGTSTPSEAGPPNAGPPNAGPPNAGPPKAGLSEPSLSEPSPSKAADPPGA